MIRRLALFCVLAGLAACAAEPAPAPSGPAPGGIASVAADPSVMTPHGY